MLRLLIAIRILFGVVSVADSADPTAESEEGVAAHLKVEEFQQLVAERLDARVEYLTSAISSEALESQIGALMERLTDLGKRLASTPSAMAQAGSMRCRIADGGVLQCTVVGALSDGQDLAAGGEGRAPPAAPADQSDH
jgi:hypothetical protein